MCSCLTSFSFLVYSILVFMVVYGFMSLCDFVFLFLLSCNVKLFVLYCGVLCVLGFVLCFIIFFIFGRDSYREPFCDVVVVGVR